MKKKLLSVLLIMTVFFQVCVVPAEAAGSITDLNEKECEIIGIKEKELMDVTASKEEWEAKLEKILTEEEVTELNSYQVYSTGFSHEQWQMLEGRELTEEEVAELERQEAITEKMRMYFEARGWIYNKGSYTKTIDNVVYKFVYGTHYLIEQYFQDEQHNRQICVTQSPEASGILELQAEIDGYPVTNIAMDAFSHNDNITNVIIPEGVKDIGISAFYDCGNLVTIEFPETLRSIDCAAFDDTPALRDVILPASLKLIGWSAFQRSAESITFKGNAPEIHYNSDALVVSDNTTLYYYSNTFGWHADRWKDLNLQVLDGGSSASLEAEEIQITTREITLKTDGKADGYRESVTLEVSIHPEEISKDALLWKSSDTNVVNIRPDGTIIAGITEGTATVTVTCDNAKAEVTVHTVLDNIDPIDPPQSELPYKDVKQGDWYYDYIYDAYEKSLMTGLDKITFGPNENLARAQFATILYRMEESPEVTYSETFPDVHSNQWYTSSVIWANQEGIVTGYSNNGYFGTGDNINREQLATMMYRYANFKEYNTEEKVDFSKFKDASKVNGFAKEAMQWAVGTGIITGKDNGTRLDPQGSATRAECATIISRFLKQYNE